MNKGHVKIALFILFALFTTVLMAQDEPPNPGVPPNVVPIPGIFALLLVALVYGVRKLKDKN